MAEDRYGLPLGTSSRAAAQAYVEGVDRLLSANEGAEESFDRAIAADPGFALAHAGRARSLQLQSRGAEARAAAAQAQEFSGGLGRRERQHVAAIALAVSGDGPRALGAIRAHLAEFPRDAMVLSPATGVYGLIGASGRQEREEELVALLEAVAPAYGHDWWFLGAYGFALTEARGFKSGAPLVERALERNPRNAHAAHAHAHVMYERGDDDGGAAFVERWMQSYPRAALLHCHLSWHWALFELARGRHHEAFTLYTERIRPDRSLAGPMPTLADSASLLWRSELAGQPRRAEHWQELARYARQSFPRVGIAFADLHCAIAFAASGETEALERWVADLRHADAEGRVAAERVLPTVAQAFGAFAAGAYPEVITLLAPMLHQFVRVGGSRAQRDLLEHTLLAAYLNAGRPEDAEALRRRRVERQPSVPIRM